MRISPKKLLQSLLYLTPVTLLALASCGGGGGGGSASTLASPYYLSVSVTGISGVSNPSSGVALHNGGDDLSFTTPGTKNFSHQVLSGSTYNISVLSQPTPTQLCTFTGTTAQCNSPMGTACTHTMPNSATTVDMSCVSAYTIGGSVNSYAGGSVVLQNNGGDNLVVANGASFKFNTPVTSSYLVTVLSNPPGFLCAPTPNTATSTGANVTNVSINCTPLSATPTPDSHLYAANSGSSNVSAYSVNASGLPGSETNPSTGSGPTAIAVYGRKYAFVTNGAANTVSAYKLSSGNLGAIVANTATGNSPADIAVHPSGKFVYVVNKLSNSISAYSVDTSTGALASIDADGSTTAYDASIATKSTPISIAIDHSGSHAYVANAGISASTSNVSVYSIDSLTGALTAIPATGVPGTSTFISTGGTTPNSVEVSPDDKLLYVTNRGSNNITSFIIGSAGELTYSSMSTAHVTNDNPVSIAIDSTGINIYVVNTGNNTVSLYHANTAGVLAYQSSLATGTTPISITIDSTGQYVYVANYGSNDISVYSVAGGTLALVNCGGGTSCNGSYFKAGTTPNAITTSP